MSPRAFSISTLAGWADMDANAHMANFAYLNKCVDARMGFFEQHGFPVTLALAGMAPDGSRFRIVNEILKGDGRLAARVRSEGGWMDLVARKLIAPPDDLREALAAMPQAPAFESLPSSIRR